MAKNGKDPRTGKLTPQQDRFCMEYVKDLNATQAAIRAGYSRKGASSQGTHLLSYPQTQARIQALQAERLARTEVDADFVLKRLIEEVNADAGDLYDDDGRLLPVKEWPAPWRRGLVSSIRTIELYKGKEPIGQMKDVVLVDRARRLELLGKHIRVNAFAERVNVGVDGPLVELFRQIAANGSVIRPAARVIEHDPQRTHVPELGQGQGDEDDRALGGGREE